MPTTELLKTADWLRQVYGTIGGSSAPSVMGVSRFMSAAKLYGRMTGDVAVEIKPPGVDQRRGIIFEPTAIQLLTERIGKPIDRHDQMKFIYSNDYPWAHALPDGWTTIENVRAPCEVKVPRPATCAKSNQTGPLDDWYVQCQHNLAITDCKVMVLGVLDVLNAELQHFLVPRDDDFVARLMKTEEDFYRHVKNRLGPPRVQEIYERKLEEPPDEQTVFVIDSQEAIEVGEHYWRCRELAEEANGMLDDAKMALINLSLSYKADVFEIPTVGRFYHKFSKPARVLDQALVKRLFPWLEDDVFKMDRAPSRPFKAYRLRGE